MQAAQPGIPKASSPCGAVATAASASATGTGLTFSWGVSGTPQL